MENNNQAIREKYNQFQRLEHLHAKLAFMVEFSNFQKNIPQLSSHDHFLIGCMYMELISDSASMRSAQEHFHSALRLDETHYMARLYSGHCYFDFAGYEKDLAIFQLALNEYLQVDADTLRREQAPWQYAQWLELVGSCFHHLGQEQTALRYFKKMLEVYRQERFDTLLDPTAIYDCIEVNGEMYNTLKQIEDAYYFL